MPQAYVCALSRGATLEVRNSGCPVTPKQFTYIISSLKSLHPRLVSNTFFLSSVHEPSYPLLRPFTFVEKYLQSTQYSKNPSSRVYFNYHILNKILIVLSPSSPIHQFLKYYSQISNKSFLKFEYNQSH